MGFLNLTLVEFLTILLPLSSVVVALYFYDRSRRRRVVSTLRFWPQRPDPPMVTRRRKLQQPWSLLLQLIALVLLLLAIADLRFGRAAGQSRHHVLILETSAWMSAAEDEDLGRTLMDVARDRARAYLRAIPAGEPVMLIRADGNPAPATVFTSDRRELEQAIEDSQPGWTAIDLAAGLNLASRALDLSVGGSDGTSSQASVGEVSYIGSGRVPGSDTFGPGVPFFRFIALGEEVEDTGISRFAARRIPDDPSRWEVVVEVRNDGTGHRALRVDFSFEKRPLGNKTVTLGPGAERELTFRLRTTRGGFLEAQLNPGDGFAANDHAGIRLPPFVTRRVDVYTSRPGRLRSLLASNPHLEARFLPPGEPGRSSAKPALVIFDRFVPEERPETAAVYFDPPASRSPVAVSRFVNNARIIKWAPDHPLARGLRSRDIVLGRAAVFEPRPGDVSIAECEAGPVIVARSEADRRQVFVGFQPAQGELQSRLITPLLFANTVGWLVPEVFRHSEVIARSPGLVEVVVGDEPEESIVVRSEEDPNLPWVLRDRRLRFFAASPGTVEVRTPSLDTHLALTLPQVVAPGWRPPEGTLRGVPPPASRSTATRTALWPWLALAALLCLAVEWKLFGRASRAGVAAVAPGTEPAPPSGGLSIAPDLSRKGRERQVVA